jgi:hypothetical protein
LQRKRCGRCQVASSFAKAKDQPVVSRMRENG